MCKTASFLWNTNGLFRFIPVRIDITFPIRTFKSYRLIPRNRNWLTIAGFQCVLILVFFVCTCVMCFGLIRSCYCHHADSSYRSTQLIFLLQVPDLSWIKRSVHRCLIFSGTPVERCCLFAVRFTSEFDFDYFTFSLSFVFYIYYFYRPSSDPWSGPGFVDSTCFPFSLVSYRYRCGVYCTWCVISKRIWAGN